MSSNGTLACCSFLQEQPDFLKEAVTGGLVLQEEMILSWHLEYDWESPVWRHLWRGLARENTLIRCDARGNGLSDWEVDDISLDAWVSDVETVVDAIGLERFPLLGISQGSAISIAYAVRHPERVSHLILYGGFALGANKCSGADKAQRQAMVTLMRLGWGLDNSAFRQMFASMFIPEGTKEQSDWFNELHRKTTSPDCAARYFDRAADIDIRDLLPRVTTPTLVMHARDELVAPFELGRQMAAEIPRARFIALIYKVMTFDLTDEETAVLLGSSAL